MAEWIHNSKSLLEWSASMNMNDLIIERVYIIKSISQVIENNELMDSLNSSYGHGKISIAFGYDNFTV